MRPIPFNLPDVGFREINGKVYVEDGFLVIRLSDALFGEFDKEKREIRIEPAALAQVRIDRGLLKDRLVLRPEDDRLLEAIPGDHDLEVALRIWRNRRDEVRALVRELSIQLEEE
ncbi:MAG: hypothetical protein KJO98_16515 [Rhodothermia bacterium]|nr:hypothetical protein [Rhodothermia bacterium]